MTRNGRFRVALGLTLGACLVSLAFLLVRPVGDGAVKLVTQQLRGQASGPFLYWTFVALVLLIVGRQPLTVLDNQALNRRLAAMYTAKAHGKGRTSWPPPPSRVSRGGRRSAGRRTRRRRGGPRCPRRARR